jgi:hypothetical protein
MHLLDPEIGLRFLALLLLGAIGYVLPTLVAFLRREKLQSLGRIVTVNLLLGWTIVGWLVALVWASNDERKLPSS